MKRRSSLAIAFVGLLVLLAVAGPASAATKGVKIGETNNRYHFSPTTVFVNAGDTVTWTNGTDTQHTVTSDSGAELRSDKIAAAATFKHTFAAEGTFAYHCEIHDYMKAKIVVLAADAALPATDTSVVPTGRSATGDRSLLIVLLSGLFVGGLAIRRFHRVSQA